MMKKQEWEVHFESWEVSGQSKKAYCAVHDLKYTSFIYYCRQFEDISKVGSFKKLTPSPLGVHAEVVLRNGIRIHLPVSFMSKTLLQTLSDV